jgi:MoaA/NifB/PqqE/SkfB family radical SAM enzyme
MTLDEVKKIFSVDFIKQLNALMINGNFGDAVMNLETADIVEYFRDTNPTMMISISSNAGARDRSFWQRLAKANVELFFCIDGFEDTHSLYRQNTLYSTVMQNAKIFIEAGGHAVWKLIEFDHNRELIPQAKKLSQELGFKNFLVINHGRDTAPVYNNQGDLVGVIGKPKETKFEVLWKIRTESETLLEDIIPGKDPKPIHCMVKTQKSMYVSSTGDVYPCCFLGFNPVKGGYGKGNYHAACNDQIRDFVQENNALTYSLEHCIQWFDKIVATWDVPTFEQGRLVICNDVCGR